MILQNVLTVFRVGRRKHTEQSERCLPASLQGGTTRQGDTTGVCEGRHEGRQGRFPGVQLVVSVIRVSLLLSTSEILLFLKCKKSQSSATVKSACQFVAVLCCSGCMLVNKLH